MTKGSICRLGSGISVTIIVIVMCCLFWVPKWRIEPTFLNACVVDFFWVLSFIVPAIFSSIDYDTGSECAYYTAYGGMWFTSWLVLTWFLNIHFSDLGVGISILYILFGALLGVLINFIPFAIINFILMCSNPSAMFSGFSGSGGSSGGGGSGTSTTKTKDNDDDDEKDSYEYTGHMTTEGGYKLDYYKINDKEFDLVHEKFFGRDVLHFRLDKSNDMFKHDYIVTTDSGKIYYADINRTRFPHEPNIYLHAEGQTIPLTYEELWKI